VVRTLVALGCLLGGLAAYWWQSAGRNPPAKDALPQVLLIGDSIALGYHAPTKAALEGEAEVSCFCSRGTRYALEHLHEYLPRAKWSVIHFNWGIHDLKGNPPQTPIAEYQKNLAELVGKLKATGAKLVWAATTPFYPNTAAYNDAARKVMEESGIPIHDLYSLVLPRRRELQPPGDCHFTKEGYQFLAERVAERVRAMLRGSPKKDPEQGPGSKAASQPKGSE